VVIKNNLGRRRVHHLRRPECRRPRAHDIRITQNRFSTRYFPRSAFFGYITAFDPTAPGNVWRATSGTARASRSTPDAMANRGQHVRVDRRQLADLLSHRATSANPPPGARAKGAAQRRVRASG